MSDDPKHQDPSEAETAFEDQFTGVGAGAMLTPGLAKRKPRNQQFGDEDQEEETEQSAPTDWAKGRVDSRWSLRTRAWRSARSASSRTTEPASLDLR